MAATGAWVAFYPDWSGFAIFSSELGAFRHANGTSMMVGFWPFGLDRAEFEKSLEKPAAKVATKVKSASS